jgi:hypothetical protein
VLALVRSSCSWWRRSTTATAWEASSAATNSSTVAPATLVASPRSASSV